MNHFNIGSVSSVLLVCFPQIRSTTHSTPIPLVNKHNTQALPHQPSSPPNLLVQGMLQAVQPIACVPLLVYSMCFLRPLEKKNFEEDRIGCKRAGLSHQPES